MRQPGALAARVLLAVFGIALAGIVLLPSRGHRVLGLVQRLAEVVASLGGSRHAAEAVIEFGANIVLFMPLGVLLPLALGLPQRRGPGAVAGGTAAGGTVVIGTVAVGALLSIGIELGQLGIPGRVSSPFDVLANTLGTLLGVLLLAAVLALRRARSPHRT